MADRSTRNEVLLTRGAEQDLESIHDYIAEFDSPASAEHVLGELKRRLPVHDPAHHAR